MDVMLGVIGGSGVASLAAFDIHETRQVASPFGKPSSEIALGEIHGTPCAFLSRHGEGHRLAPSQIPYRANIDAMKRLGVSDIISISACGSFREELPPGHILLIDQFVDRTRGRPSSFFGEGLVAHVPMADPVSKRLLDLAEAACRAETIPHKRGGTFLIMEGPQFSTRAESHLYKSWNCDAIGMTNMPEAKLAREAEIPYATLACVTDYDSWRAPDADVDVSDIMSILQSNVEKAARIVAHIAQSLGKKREADPQGLDSILDASVITQAPHRARAKLQEMDAILARFLREEAKRKASVSKASPSKASVSKD